MTWEDIKRKLTSRKFWAALAGFVSMLAVALGATEATATQVTALIMAGASVIAYIIGEGLADAAGAGGGSLPEDETDTGVIVAREIDKRPEM